MQADENKLIFNKKDHNGKHYVSKTTFIMNFTDKEIKVIFSLN